MAKCFCCGTETDRKPIVLCPGCDATDMEIIAHLRNRVAELETECAGKGKKPSSAQAQLTTLCIWVTRSWYTLAAILRHKKPVELTTLQHWTFTGRLLF